MVDGGRPAGSATAERRGRGSSGAVAADAGPRLLPARVDEVARRWAPALAGGTATDGTSGGATGPGGGSGRRLLRPLLWALLVAAAGQSLLHVFDVWALEGRVTRLHADEDLSVAGWLGTVTTWTVACGAALLALLVRPARGPLLLTAGIAAFLSFDDMVVVHELVARLAKKFDLFPHDGYLLWPLVYLPLMVVLGWLLLRVARTFDVGNGRFLVAGLTCLVVAVGLEASAPLLFALGSDHNQPLYESEVLLEEALETLGWGTIAFGLLASVVDVLLSRGAETASGRPASGAR